MSELPHHDAEFERDWSHLDQFDHEVEMTDGGLYNVLISNANMYASEDPILYSTMERVASYFDRLFSGVNSDPSHTMASVAMAGMMVGISVGEYKLGEDNISAVVRTKLRALENHSFAHRDWLLDGAHLKDEGYSSREVLKETLIEYAHDRYELLEDGEQDFIRYLSMPFKSNLDRQETFCLGFAMVMGLVDDHIASEAATAEYQELENMFDDTIIDHFQD